MTAKSVTSSVVKVLLVIFAIPCAVASIAMAKTFMQHSRDIKSGLFWE